MDEAFIDVLRQWTADYIARNGESTHQQLSKIACTRPSPSPCRKQSLLDLPNIQRDQGIEARKSLPFVYSTTVTHLDNPPFSDVSHYHNHTHSLADGRFVAATASIIHSFAYSHILPLRLSRSLFSQSSILRRRRGLCPASQTFITSSNSQIQSTKS